MRIPSFLAGLSLLAAMAAQAQVKSVRIAHHFFQNLDDIDARFLDYAAAMGYTHVLAHGDLFSSSHAGEWDKGTYKGTATATGLRKRFADLFRRADARGLGVIPCFNMASKHSGHWRISNPAIAFNPGSNEHQRGTLYSPDPNGIQKSFRSYLEVVKLARADASPGATLPYIHIGHDENYKDGGFLLPGQAGNNDRAWITAWVKANPGDPNAYKNAYLALMAREIDERVQDVKSVFPSPPGIIYWADHWDPQFYALKRKADGKLAPTTGIWAGTADQWIFTHEVMNRPELVPHKSILIPMLWLPSFTFKYFGTSPLYEKTRTYDPNVTLSALVGAGFNRILLGVDYQPWNPPAEWTRAEGWGAVNGWVKHGQIDYKSRVIGYAAHTWTEPQPGTSQPFRWKDNPQEYRFRVFSDLARRGGFYRQRTDLVQLWSNNGRLYAETYASDGTNYSRHDGGYELGSSANLQFFQGDINHDDKADIIQLRDNNGRLDIETYASFPSGTGTHRFFPLGRNDNAGGAGAIQFLSGDINADFSTDIFQLWNNSGLLYVETYAWDEATWRFQRFSGNYHLGTADWTHYRAGDLDGDGDTDLMGTRTYFNGNLELKPFLSDGSQFVQGTAHVTATVPHAAGGFLMDVDGDGDQEFVQLAVEGSKLRFEAYYLDGSGSNSRFRLLSSSAWLATRTTEGVFLPGDFDRNGRMDMARLLNTSGNLQVELFLSNGNTLVYKSTKSSGLGVFAGDYHVADRDRDGRSDLIKLRNVGGRLTVESCRSDGSNLQNAVVNSNLGGHAALKYIAADIDGNLP